ncbi:efflux transporter, outer membrane factor (OMF) lipoprotein, NodT family [Rhodoferax sp. OV413]|uniref:efflux transporter outer membrane subunit n=1 Tax=Rhodoferax sp. OV413 TaxID=1855285 RepID=UPI00088418F7|nr:efflux transporter outer membrane subunit [Rhodoferax sp. OV413]SDO77913.1 efflux transporter, outer membrane factor (OMF) lipoprotein, NodT family [Rhodoferax sp. OV413]
MTPFKPLLPCTLLAALLLAGCATPQAPYSAPAATLPAQWQYANADSGASTDAWWKNFNDPVLDQLVEQALLRNNNLAAATIKVRQAQLQVGLAENRPNFSGSLSSGTSRTLSGNAVTSRSSGVSLGASYEIDLWNKLGSQRDVALWEARATAQDREATALALVATTAQLYWQLGYLNQRLAANLQSIATAQKTLELVQAQVNAGAAGGLELAEARQSLLSLQASQTTLQQQAVAANTALALLFDAAPSALPNPPQTLPNSQLPEVAAGLPAELLARRPDLRAAELRLRESHANISATRASYYPALSLTGALGTSSTALLNLLQNPVASLGLGLSLPFLNQKEMDLNIRVAQAQSEEAVVNFRQTLYTALGDVENALSARQQYRAQAVLLEQVLQAAIQAERLYEVRYRAGSVALKPWLDAQESRRSAEIALAENRLNQFNNHATLVQALGGDAAALPGMVREDLQVK